MSSFTEPLIVSIDQDERAGRGTATIYSTFYYYVGKYMSDDVVEIPVGFKTDFCSIPALGRPFFPILGKAAKAAVIHDYLIREGIRKRKESDDIFNEAMKISKVPTIRRLIMYYAVRIAGILNL